jgi:hypothetical protein
MPSNYSKPNKLEPKSQISIPKISREEERRGQSEQRMWNVGASRCIEVLVTLACAIDRRARMQRKIRQRRLCSLSGGSISCGAEAPLGESVGF